MPPRPVAALCAAMVLAACTPHATPETRAVTSSVPSPTSPIPCNSDSVGVTIATGTLEGSFLCPVTAAPWPGVLLIAGSGPTDRNGNSAGLSGANNSLRLLAEALAARGIASLRYDKRGIGASRAALTSEADLRFDMLADDAAAWVRRMRLDPRLSTITVVGHSEGSLLGMLAAEQAGADAFVSLEGAGRPATEILHEQLSARAPAALVVASDSIMAQLVSGHTVDSVPRALAALFRPSVQPYLISWFRHDPAADLARLRVPVLIVQGTTDIQVGAEDARRLAASVPGARLLTIEGMNHVLKMVPADRAAQLRSYSDPALPVAPELVEAVGAFVKGVKRK